MADWKGKFNPGIRDALDADGMPLLALSLRQPWLWAVLKAGKRIENRKWATSYKGPLLLHASKGCTEEEVEGFIAFVMDAFGPFQAGAMMAMLPCPIPKQSSVEHGFYRGGICGIAHLAGVYSATTVLRKQQGLPGFDDRVALDRRLDDAQRRWCIPGQKGWMLDDVLELPFVPCQGALGLFTPDPMTLDKVHAHLRSIGWKTTVTKAPPALGWPLDGSS
jgi:hypothetical protein